MFPSVVYVPLRESALESQTQEQKKCHEVPYCSILAQIHRSTTMVNTVRQAVLATTPRDILFLYGKANS